MTAEEKHALMNMFEEIVDALSKAHNPDGSALLISLEVLRRRLRRLEAALYQKPEPE